MITVARFTPLTGNSWTALAAHSLGALLLAGIFCAGVLTFGPVLLAVLRHTDRRIERWVEQDAPRPVVPTAAGHDTNPAEEASRG